MKSRSGYWFGGGLLVAAVVGAILFAIASGADLVNTVDDFERVGAGEQRTLQLEDRKYVVYYEADGAGETFAPSLEVQVAAVGSGEAIDIEDYGTSLTYSIGGHDGTAQATVTPPSAGAYRVSVAGDPQADDAGVALGDSISGPLLRTILGTLAIGLVLGVSGVVLLIVTAVRRSRARTRTAGY